MVKPKNMLRKKLYRDMSRAAMQFLSIIALCALGTFAFSALDGMARMIRTTLNTYYEENNLADFWITLPTADRASMEKLAALPDVEAVCARASVDLDTTLPGDVSVSVTVYDGEMTINKPLLREGALLEANDPRGCLVEERFAQSKGLSLGDRLTVKLRGRPYSFTIRGVVVSPEYIVVTDGMAADPDKYGFILVNACAIPELPLTQIVATMADGADSETVQAEIEAALPTQMFENMTLIFPVLAYAVAALIVMTTLSRMIDNQRMQMGTLQALGFSAHQIKMHYLSYAIAPSAVGAVLGTLIGHNTLPFLLWDTLIAQNEMPYRLTPPISAFAWGMTVLSVVMSVFILLHSYKSAAKECTASLLRAKPPKSGKRILLDRITWLWSRFSFNTKMVVRNLMRNKLRTVMMLVGLLCCTMLIITSLGLQDSVTSLSVKYYTKSLDYDVIANLTGEADKAESYERRADAEAAECLMEKSISLRTDAGTRTELMTVLEDDQTMIHLGENEAFVRLQTGTAAVTYKLTKTLNLHVGDVVRVYLPGDSDPFDIVIGQIVYNNVTQGVYLNRTTWESLRKGEFIPTGLMLKNPSDAYLAQLEDMDEVDSLDYPAKLIDDMMQMLDSLSAVFTMLTCIALALAFVICYNMGLMNFVERTREYATLKVLGYHQKEIRRLIMRENAIISFLGVALGIWPGITLTNVIMHTCEPESGFYPGAPTIQSIVIACVVTYLFSELLQRLLARKVRRIDMVEALKSVE